VAGELPGEWGKDAIISFIICIHRRVSFKEKEKGASRRLRRRWEDNIKMGLKEIGLDGVGCSPE
jgi:hypothetical protein